MLCDRADPGYALMYDLGLIFIIVVFALFMLAFYLLNEGFHWQYGNRVRDEAP